MTAPHFDALSKLMRTYERMALVGAGLIIAGVVAGITVGLERTAGLYALGGLGGAGLYGLVVGLVSARRTRQRLDERDQRQKES